MRCLIIGFGSIGKKHLEALNDLGHQVAILSRRKTLNIIGVTVFNDLGIALKNFKPSYIIVCNETSMHQNALGLISETGFQGRVLVEKPLFSTYQDVHLKNESNIKVGYNLRFHPCIKWLKAKIIQSNKKIIKSSFIVGQNLNEWRPGSDYKKSYSARSEMGGGVLRDLSHELDLLLYLFGSWKECINYSCNSGVLGISSEDLSTSIIKMKNGVVATVELNYLDHITRRAICVTFQDETIIIDLLNNSIKTNKETFEFNSENTYQSLHNEIILRPHSSRLCSYKNGLDVNELIDYLEQSNMEKIWKRKLTHQLSVQSVQEVDQKDFLEKI